MKQLLMGLGVASFVFSCSAPKPACSADNCTGCCPASGVCQAGDTAAQCGAAGSACVACGMGQTCNAGTCEGDAGTGGGGGGAGGGATGGGAGGGTQAVGGGGTGGCAQIADAGSGGIDQGSFAADMNAPGNSQEVALVTIPTGTAGSTDVLGIVWYRMTGAFPTTPYNGTIQPLSYAACHDCVIYSTGCDAMGNHCSVNYLAQAGILSVTTSTTKSDAGTFVGGVTDARFVQWDFDNDEMIDGGACIDMHQGTFNAAWP